MHSLGLLVLAAAAALALGLPARAQIIPAPPYYAMPPSAYADNPVQQQILQNYRTQLLQSQREMLLQNPSGLGRDQIEVNRQLNAYNLPNLPPGPAALPPTAPGFSLAPFSPSGMLSPPFNAAPQP